MSSIWRGQVGRSDSSVRDSSRFISREDQILAQRAIDECDDRTERERELRAREALDQNKIVDHLAFYQPIESKQSKYH